MNFIKNMVTYTLIKNMVTYTLLTFVIIVGVLGLFVVPIIALMVLGLPNPIPPFVGTIIGISLLVGIAIGIEEGESNE